MELGTIEREVHVEASQEIVFEVISSPDHIREWWNGAETDISPVPGSTSELAWAKGTADQHIEHITVVDAVPPRLFSFRWVYAGETPTASNSLLVTFELLPSGEGTLVRMTESGFREKGWEIAEMEAAYADHSNGWDVFVPALGAYVDRLVAAS